MAWWSYPSAQKSNAVFDGLPSPVEERRMELYDRIVTALTLIVFGTLAAVLWAMFLMWLVPSG